ncbi:hypothetical protein [Phyllobacterium sophorae]|jgi:hypothetical protein|uniref:Uncharacterized protein n=1 Tax=Phyllobacterium sophorae TaxID=1520277 RepID=A0A2P7BG79_9HYPH|nr:hypothetical protein [Phyllobacterium sophorae]PSH65439.1 hypothetical protein CU103_10650 [Phyllobacterium sophorae]
MMTNEEPTLDELLREPIIRLVMVRDGIDISEARAMMEQAKFRLNRGCIPTGLLQRACNPCLNTIIPDA